jgi:hypothetical protein
MYQHPLFLKENSEKNPLDAGPIGSLGAPPSESPVEKPLAKRPRPFGCGRQNREPKRFP